MTLRICRSMLLLQILVFYTVHLSINALDDFDNNVNSNDTLLDFTLIPPLTTQPTNSPINSTLIPTLTTQTLSLFDFLSKFTLIPTPTTDLTTQTIDSPLNPLLNFTFIPDLTTQSIDSFLNSTPTTNLTTQTPSFFHQELDKQLKIFSNYCLSREELEGVFGNKVKFRLLAHNLWTLFGLVYKHMGQNEIRRFFHLKQQSIDFLEMVEEEGENSMESFDPDMLRYFQDKISGENEDLFNSDTFRSKEIDFATTYLDKKFPGIKPLFHLKFKEDTLDIGNDFNQETIDRLFKSSLEIRDELDPVISKLLNESIFGIYAQESDENRCYRE